MIRAADEHDLEAIVRIWREGSSQALGGTPFAQEEDFLRDFFRRRLRAIEPPFGFWVACERGRVLGWQALLPFDNNPATRSCVAESSTYIAQAHARRGVGEALLRHAMQCARASALQYILAFISPENPGAWALVEKCGWTRVGMLPETQKAPARPGVIVAVYAPPPPETGSLHVDKDN